MGLKSDLQHVLNSHSVDSKLATPDYVLAEYLKDCLKAFDKACLVKDIFWTTEPSEQEAE